MFSTKCHFVLLSLTLALFTLGSCNSQKPEHVAGIWVVDTEAEETTSLSDRQLKGFEIMSGLIDKVRAAEPDSAMELKFTIRLADRWRQVGKYRTAEELYQRALSILKVQKDTSSEKYIRTLEGLGDCYYHTADVKDTTKNYEQLLKAFESVSPDSWQLRQCRYRIAKSYLDNGKYEQSLRLFDKNVNDLKAMGTDLLQPEEYALNLSLMGDCYQNLEKLWAAEEAYKQALTAWSKLSDQKKNQAICLFRLGEVSQDMGRKKEAFGYLQQAVPRLKEEFGADARITECARKRLADALWRSGKWIDSVKVNLGS